MDEALYVRVSFCGLPYSRPVRETPAHSVVPRHLPRFLPEGMAPAVTGWSMLRATVVLCQSAVRPERDFIHPDIQLFEPRSLKQTLLPHLKGWAPLPAGWPLARVCFWCHTVPVIAASQPLWDQEAHALPLHSLKTGFPVREPLNSLKNSRIILSRAC